MSILWKIIRTYKDAKKSAESVSKKTGKHRLVVLADIMTCIWKYSASPNNYELFEFYKLTSAQRSTYVTYGLSRSMINTYNDPKDIDIFENKLKFAEVFSDMFCRDYLNIEDMQLEDFEKFAQGKEKIICKPYAGSQGADIAVFHVRNARELFLELKNKYPKGFMIEEWIKQHPSISEIYPDAVNCLRVITVYDGKKAHILTGGLTFGTETEIANGSQPSIIAPVDFETGIIHKPAATFGSELYKNHPKTGARMEGVRLPFWDDTMTMIQKACERVPTVGYIGWDIAITPDGPILIEGNTTPGYKYYQIPDHLVDGIGNRAKYEQYLNRKR